MPEEQILLAFLGQPLQSGCRFLHTLARLPQRPVAPAVQRAPGGVGLPPADAPEFVPIGVVGQMSNGGPALLARIPDIETTSAGNTPAKPDELRRPSGLEARAGVIEIDLPDGARVRVDAFVDARALARVLSALKRLA